MDYFHLKDKNAVTARYKTQQVSYSARAEFNRCRQRVKETSANYIISYILLLLYRTKIHS